MPILLNFFKPKVKPFEKPIEDSAIIDETASVSKINTYIGHNVKIGKNVAIYPNVSIFEGTEIGDGQLFTRMLQLENFLRLGKVYFSARCSYWV